MPTYQQETSPSLKEDSLMLSDEGVGMAALYWCGQFTWGDFRLRTRPRCTAKCSTLVAVLAYFVFGQQISLSLHL